MKKIKLIMNAVIIAAFFCVVYGEDFVKQNIEIVTDNGYVISADIITFNENPGPALLAIHRVGTSGNDWNTMLEYLSRSGISKVLIFDIPGHGGSLFRNRIEGISQDSVLYSQFNQDDYISIADDVSYIFSYLKSLPGADSLKCGIIGDHSGAIYAVKTAVKDNNVEFLVLISPEIINHGVTINDDIRNLSDIPTLIIAFKEDEIGWSNAEWLNDNCSSQKKQFKLFFRSYNSADILGNSPKLGEYVGNWLKKKIK